MTRFAPAPTGALHLGHVANAIYVWGLAARHGAKVLLRVEDHDRQRSRAAYEAALLDDLDWLGFAPDLFPTAAFRAGACESRQSNRDAIYRKHADALAARGLLYGCTCSRRQNRENTRFLKSVGNRVFCTCRAEGLPLTDDTAWRLRIEPGSETFDDLLLGPVTQDAAALLGDPVIRDRRRNWTYQFAVVVDDLLQGVDLVIRGEDLVPSTGLQIQMARILGRPLPARFGHHPLIMKSPTEKLSKSDGDTGIGALREAGLSAEAAIGRAAFLVGLTPSARPIEAGDVASLFPEPSRQG